MKPFGIIIGLIVIGVVAVLAMGSDVDVKDSGALPDVDVQVDAEAGRMPDVDVQTPDVDVNMEERTVNVPDVDVDMEERTIEVPNVDYNAAEDSAIDEAAEPEAMERE